MVAMRARLTMRLLYLCDSDGGGIADLCSRQGRALSEMGLSGHVLMSTNVSNCSLGWGECASGAADGFPGTPGSRWQRLIGRIADTKAVARIAAEEALKGDCDALLIACSRSILHLFGRRFCGRPAVVG